jgi:gliding motility-associated-like protein
VVNIKCNGASTGSINTTISGGTPSYTITWNPVQPPNPIITNLTAGVYSLSVLDTKGCTTNSVYTLTQPAAMIMVSSNTTPATCGNSNGTATIVISGGVTPYTYNWNTPSPILTNTAGGLAPGVWILTATDNKGCTLSNSVSIFAPPLPSVTAAFTSPNCFAQSNASASLSAFGVSPFTYSWSPGGLTTGTISGVLAGLYTATVTDGFGCLTYTSVNITQPNLLSIQTPSAQTICYGTNGNVYAASSGGTPPYTYTWVDPNAVITGTTGGPFNNTYTTTSQYTVSVVDSKGCSDGPRLILVNVTPQLIVASKSYTACSKDEVILTPTITSPGNGGPYNYTWSGGGTNAVKTVTADFATNPNTYTLTVSDGCTIPNGSTVFNITVRPLPTASWTSTENKGCSPLTVLYEVTGDSTTTNSKPFLWSFTGGNEPKALNTSTVLIVYPDPGTYSLGLVITNKYGCKTRYEGELASSVYPLPLADFYANPASTSIIEPTVSFNNLSQGGISYSWDFADYDYPNGNSSMLENPVHLYNLAGIYNVFLKTTNEFGCIAIANHTVEITSELAVYIPNAFTPDDNKVNDTFQPKGVGISEDRYKMEVFDRWGGQIFSSNSFRLGWDGKLKGGQVKAEDGVYVYKISLYDLAGNHKYYTGTVTLLNSR